jgi:hypothetical protein
MYNRKKASLARGELRRLNATRRGQEEVWNLAGGNYDLNKSGKPFLVGGWVGLDDQR